MIDFSIFLHLKNISALVSERHFAAYSILTCIISARNALVSLFLLSNTCFFPLAGFKGTKSVHSDYILQEANCETEFCSLIFMREWLVSIPVEGAGLGKGRS